MFSALISQREIIDKYGIHCDCLEKDYVDYFSKIGISVIPISNFTQPDSIILKQADIIILTGGGDLSAKYYTDTSVSVNEQSERDRTEHFLFNYALKHHIPILGICRGMQYINAILGGKVSKNFLTSEKRTCGQDHIIKSSTETLIVNHYHNDYVQCSNLANDLIPLFFDEENGSVEIFICPQKKIMAFQYHPERAFTDMEANIKTQKMIKTFIENKGEL